MASFYEKLPLDLVDIFFVNEIEGAAIAGAEPELPLPRVLDALVKRFPKAEIVLTAGKEGAYYGFEALREKGEIVDVPVVDTVGAGDTFSGYFIAARYKNYPVKKAMEIASKAASIAVPLVSEVFYT